MHGGHQGLFGRAGNATEVTGCRCVAIPSCLFIIESAQGFAAYSTCAVRSTEWRLERLLGTNINVITGQNEEDTIKQFDEVVSGGNHSRLRVVIVGCHMHRLSVHQAAAMMRNIERENNISRRVSSSSSKSLLVSKFIVFAFFIDLPEPAA